MVINRRCCRERNEGVCLGGKQRVEVIRRHGDWCSRPKVRIDGPSVPRTSHGSDRKVDLDLQAIRPNRGLTISE